MHLEVVCLLGLVEVNSSPKGTETNPKQRHIRSIEGHLLLLGVAHSTGFADLFNEPLKTGPKTHRLPRGFTSLVQALASSSRSGLEANKGQAFPGLCCRKRNMKSRPDASSQFAMPWNDAGTVSGQCTAATKWGDIVMLGQRVLFALLMAVSLKWPQKHRVVMQTYLASATSIDSEQKAFLPIVLYPCIPGLHARLFQHSSALP